MKHSDETVEQILSMSNQGMSSRQIAHALWGKYSSKSTVNDIIARNRTEDPKHQGPKVLFLDVEVQGSVNISFPRFKANISPDAVIQEPYLLTYAANWLHDPMEDIKCVGLNDYPMFYEDDYHNDVLLVENLWELLDEADVVVAHNAGFDTGQINARFAYYGIDPPSPFKVICTLQALKKHFKLPANSLDAATKYFELERKQKHDGIKLWVDCFLGYEEAFEKMKQYNIGDIPTLRQLYMKVRPFMQNHPNMSLYYGDDKVRCNNCGGHELEMLEDKYAYTNVSKFNVLKCKGCGAVKRTRINVLDKEKRESLLMNIAK